MEQIDLPREVGYCSVNIECSVAAHIYDSPTIAIQVEHSTGIAGGQVERSCWWPSWWGNQTIRDVAHADDTIVDENGLVAAELVSKMQVAVSVQGATIDQFENADTVRVNDLNPVGHAELAVPYNFDLTGGQRR